MPGLQGYTMGTYKEEKVNEAVTRPLDARTGVSAQRSKPAHGSPSNVRLFVTGESSLTVQFDSVDDGVPATHFKVEWSTDAAFDHIAGDDLVEDRSSSSMEYEIRGLQQGQAYFVRVSACSPLGHGDAVTSVPAYATPSSWRQVDEAEPRGKGDDYFLARLLRDYRSMLKTNQAKLDDVESTPLHPPPPATKPASARRGGGRWRALFSSAAKFHKSLKAGLYFACAFYHEDRVLATSDESLPAILVDSAYVASDCGGLPSELHWLMKLSHAWRSVDELREKMERLGGAAAGASLELRLKMLRAASLLQASLGLQDLGRVFYKVVEDEASGAAAMVLVNRVQDMKSVNLASSLKWLPATRLQKRQAPLADRLTDFICYHQVSSFPLSRGLYLGLVMANAAVDNLYFLVNAATPNVLPHVKLRSRPHVSRSEWHWLTDNAESTDANDTADGREFGQLVTSGFMNLTMAMGIRHEDSLSYRLYDAEVLECSADVSFLAIVPPRESVCAVRAPAKGAKLRPNLVELPLKVFELIHLSTYAPRLLEAYSEVAGLMDVDSQLAQHAVRSALANEEAAVWRAHLNNVAWYQRLVEDRWRLLRWPFSVVAYARDKATGGVSLARLLARLSERRTTSRSDRRSAGGGGGSRVADRPQPEGSSADEQRRVGALRHDALPPPPGSSLESEARSDAAPAPAEALRRRPQKRQQQRQTDFIRVYAAYACGLAAGTSVVLHVTHKTTCREVIGLVVRRLEHELRRRRGGLDAVSARSSSSPTTTEAGASRHDDDGPLLRRFCLEADAGDVAVVLEDDALLLAWCSVWLRGRLSVRLKDDDDSGEDIVALQGRMQLTAL